MQTPKDAAPPAERRQLAAQQTIEALDGVEQLPVHEQLARLGAAQEALAGILRGDTVQQANIPGIQ